MLNTQNGVSDKNGWPKFITLMLYYYTRNLSVEQTGLFMSALDKAQSVEGCRQQSNINAYLMMPAPLEANTSS